MQILARDGYTDDQIRSLLEAPALTVSGGLELLSPTLTVLEDLSDDLAAGRVDWKLLNAIHGTCSLTITRTLQWGVALVRPYTILSDGTVTARFNVGVYTLVTPERRVADTPETYEVSGFDRLYLLSREVGDTYTVTAGTEVLTAVRNAIAAAGLSGVLLDGSATGKVVPTTKVWPLLQTNTGSDGRADNATATTWLRIVNDLLKLINYRGLFTDENGLYRSEPYVEPEARGPSYVLDADSPKTIVGPARTLVEDTWKRPNKWVFINTTLAGDPPPAPSEGAGIYTVNDTADQAVRGLVWAEVVQVEAADQASLVGLGNARVAADKRITSTLKLTVGPFPVLGHADIYTYLDAAVGGRKVQLVSATVDLLGGDTPMTLERVG